MTLISIRNVRLAFGGPPVLEDVSLQVRSGERICLLGRNGVGKSTLLKLMAGEHQPDSGSVEFRQNLRVATLPQQIPGNLKGSVFDVVMQGFGTLGEQLSRFHVLSRVLEDDRKEFLAELTRVQQAIEERGGWKAQQRIEQVLSHLKLEADIPVETLSGGVLRRVLLARALVIEPDVLLLDEPTNHLDIESILWLEEFLRRENITLVFVTHDREFLRALATRIVELDRGRLFDFACDYETFLRRKDEWLNAEELERTRFDKKLAEEEIWIRKGVKERRTRNEGRVRALLKMREERRRRRERLGSARFELLEAGRSGRLVAEMKNVSFGYGERPLIHDFSTTVLRGDRVGIIGPNGAGKTTLLKLLLGELGPQAGEVRTGTNLQVLYFDQLRQQLDPDKTVQQNLCGEQDTVIVGSRPRHVVGYLKDFLFTPDRIRSPVRILSGGERNRLLLARLFTREANVLVLDEPTNDLDLETLDLLEELLAEFKGTLFLVSHDRAFLNRVVTSTIAFEGNGKVVEYVGGYDDWLRQRPQPEAVIQEKKSPREKSKKVQPRRLTFRERKELEELPGHIEALENEQAGLHGRMADPAFYREAGETVAAARKRLGEVEKELEESYARWEELDILER